ncbi:MAG: energy-coupling factor transporter ATPase [Nitrospirales bacterium]|nr:energy-coupling factor transporter ATPase [Nitrospirales bacterium]
MSLSQYAPDSRRWWADLIAVWRDTRQIVLIAQIAAIYAAILIPFKVGIPIVPGFVELRPANAIPIVASLLFGPAAAWGAGIGNVIGDCFGTLGPASFFGLLGNFIFGYLPYVLWGHLGWFSSGRPPLGKSWSQIMEYGVVCVIASAACAGVIAWGVEWLGLLPFIILAPAIFFNNVVMGLFLGPPLLGFLYPRVQRWRLRYEDIRESDSSHIHPSKTLRSHESMGSEKANDHLDDAIVDCRGLSFQYASGSAPVLRNISFSLASGELVVLLGRSGSGKSTICYACNGLIPHMIPGIFSGTLRVKGRGTMDEPVWKQAGRVGLVFQDFDTQLVATTVEGELLHPLEFRDPLLSPDEVRRRVVHALSQIGLAACVNRDPMTMSGGQRQRLVMASVLVQEPAVLVLDEPGSDLDPAGRKQLREVLRNLRQEGIAVLMTEHDDDFLSQADRVLILDQAQIVWDGKPEALLRQPRLMRDCGLRPFVLTECFEEWGVKDVPISVEEAWIQAEALNLCLSPPGHVLNDTLRLGCFSEQESNVASPLIQVDNVSFRYDEHLVLDDVSFTIRSGDFWAVLGQNGSGKSTLARLLNGLLIPTRGTVVVDGMDTRTTSMNELARRVGLVFQNPDHQIFADTVWEEVAFSAKNMGCSKDEIVDRVQKSLAAVGLPFEGSRDLDPFSLRKGERQRIAVASVLATRPDVLIFDEPTTGLDPNETDRMMAVIRGLNQQGHTIVMITHSMGLVAAYARRCLLIHSGKILADGTPREVFADPVLIQSASLEIPVISRFSQRWGQTLLTVEEVKASCRPGIS